MNTRWDQVVERSGPIPGGLPPQAHRSDAAAKPSAPTLVNAWLYGALAGSAPPRPLALALPPAFTLGQLLAALRERCGDVVMERIVDRDGAKRRACRVFVNGLPLDDLDSPAAHAGPGPDRVEVILVMGIEGG